MLKARVITALLLAAGLLAVLFLLSVQAAGMVFAVIAGLSAWEWGGLMKAGRNARVAYALVIFAACLLVGWLGLQLMLWQLAAVFWLVVAPLWLWRRWPLTSFSMMGYFVGALLLLPAWAAMPALLARGPWWLFGVMALVAAADIGAYFAGRAFGRHKLAPAISPGKTWEGVVGGLAAVWVYVAVVAAATGFATGIGWSVLMLAAFVLLAVSVVGDLFESLVKRQAGMKDSSQLLPGHGGILDRIDSLTAALPLSALALLGAGL